MTEQFYTIVTKIGKAKIANANALGTKLNLSMFAIGDSSGTYYNPTEDTNSLKNEVWRGNISSITIDEENPNWIVIQVVIPSDIGGFMIREAGVFDADGNLIAIGKYPETYKPVVSEGSAKDLYVKMILEVSNTSSVTLKVDPTVILATKKDIEILDNNFNTFKESVTTQMADIIALSKSEPETSNTELWLQDVGENFNIPTGDGVVIANASMNNDKDIKFEEI